MIRRSFDRFVTAVERFAMFSRRQWFRWWSIVAMLGFVLVLLLTDRSELRGTAWGVLAVALLVVGLPWIATVLVDTLVTAVIIILSGVGVIRLVRRLGPKGPGPAKEEVPAGHG